MPLACRLEGQTVIKLFLNPMTHAISLPQKHGPPETWNNLSNLLLTPMFHLFSESISDISCWWKVQVTPFASFSPPEACSCDTTSRALGTLSQGAMAKKGNSGTKRSPPTTEKFQPQEFGMVPGWLLIGDRCLESPKLILSQHNVLLRYDYCMLGQKDTGILIAKELVCTFPLLRYPSRFETAHITLFAKVLCRWVRR